MSYFLSLIDAHASAPLRGCFLQTGPYLALIGLALLWGLQLCQATAASMRLWFQLLPCCPLFLSPGLTIPCAHPSATPSSPPPQPLLSTAFLALSFNGACSAPCSSFFSVSSSIIWARFYSKHFSSCFSLLFPTTGPLLSLLFVFYGGAFGHVPPITTSPLHEVSLMNCASHDCFLHKGCSGHAVWIFLFVSPYVCVHIFVCKRNRVHLWPPELKEHCDKWSVRCTLLDSYAILESEPPCALIDWQSSLFYQI